MGKEAVYDLAGLYQAETLASMAERKRADGDLETYHRLANLFKTMVGVGIDDRRRYGEELLDHIRVHMSEAAFKSLMANAE